MSPTTPISRCRLMQLLQLTSQLAAHTRVKEEGDEGGKWMDMKAGVTGTLTPSNHLMTTVMAAMAAAATSCICQWQQQRQLGFGTGTGKPTVFPKWVLRVW